VSPLRSLARSPRWIPPGYGITANARPSGAVRQLRRVRFGLPVRRQAGGPHDRITPGRNTQVDDFLITTAFDALPRA